MQSSRRDGRDLLIHQLSNAKAHSRDAVTRHLFERNDHISTSAVNITTAYKGSKMELERNCKTWANHAAEIVDQLSQDMSLALKITNWDRNSLKDTLALIDFLCDCFGAWTDLSDACKNHKNQKVQVREGPAKTYSTVGNDLKDSLARANHIRTKLYAHLKSENSNAKDYVDDLIINSGNSKIVKIPTATLRELFIFNEAYGRRKEIWRCVDSMSQLHEVDEASTPTQLEDLIDLVSSIFSKFQDEPQPKKSKEAPKEEAPNAKRKKYAWLSQSLVLVLDTENKLILTGGSQPICHVSGLFSRAVKTITNLRVGEEFAEIADNCSKEFADRAIKVIRSQSINNKDQLSSLKASKIEELKLYNQVVNEDKSSWHDNLPAPTKDKPVLGWACEGSTFEFKPPCLRCQSIYPKWYLHKRPRDEDGRKSHLVQSIFSHLVPENPCLDMNWAYCAETVVASKLYLLHNGTLALV